MFYAWLPLLSLLTAATLAAQDVTRFGAKPDDGQDDTAAFLAAFKEAKAKGGKRIVIPKGRYELRANGNAERPEILFQVADLDGLTIERHGAELMLSGTWSVFSFPHCRNVTVSGLPGDWARPPFSEGTVVASAARHFDVLVRDEYPVKGGEPVGAFMTYHADTRLPDGRDLDVYDSVERTDLIAPQVLRVHLKREINVPVGKLLVLRHQVYGYDRDCCDQHGCDCWCHKVQRKEKSMDWTNGEMTLMAAEIRQKADDLSNKLIAYANTSVSRDNLDAEEAWNAMFDLYSVIAVHARRMVEEWQKTAPPNRKAV